MEKLITIHYSEIALKGSNRGEFESKLIKNIKTAIYGEKFEKIERKESRILLFLNENSDEKSIIEKLKCVFGINWFSVALSCRVDIEEINKIVLQEAKRSCKGKTLKVKAKRSDKQFKMNSMEINRTVGELLYASGFKIDVNYPEVEIEIQILRERANIVFDKITGLGGLPVGTAGKVLCLLSGGIDSPVAAWLMAKRGCEVDFIHVHTFPRNNDVKESKIPKLAEIIGSFMQRKPKLFVFSHNAFYTKTFSLNTRSELILFRRFILKVANEIAKKHGYLGIVTGDNLAQVASQTLENLATTNEASQLPVYRPLLTYDKREIISLAEKIGTYDLSIEPYKDCCSLVAQKHPSTKTKLDEVKEIEKYISIDRTVENALKEVEEL